MGTYNLDHAFNPASIAVVGASERQGKIGQHLMTNLIQGGFKGSIYPVNPNHKNIMGYKSYASIMDIGQEIDLVAVAVAIQDVPSIISQCVKAQAKNVLVISAGGKETGAEGESIENEIIETAAGTNVRIIGPNCLGIIAPQAKLNASFSASMPREGNMAFVSQSGAICTSILDLSLKEGVGFSHFISVGSMVDVDFGDLIDFLGQHPSVKSILLYVEHLTNLRKFMSAARSVSRIKPIIALKSGKSPIGALAAASHTGALAGEDAIYDAAFKRAGIVRVSEIEELFDCASLLGKYKTPTGSRMAIVTNGGGPGVMAIDAMVDYGIKPAELSRETSTKIDAILSGRWSRRNPIDILGDATRNAFKKVIDCLLHDNDLDALTVIFCPQAVTEPLAAAQALIEAWSERKKPLFAVWMGGHSIESSVRLLNDTGIATFSSPERAVKAFSYLVQYINNRRALLEIPTRSSSQLVSWKKTKTQTMIRENLLSQQYMPSLLDCLEILDAYNIPTITTKFAHHLYEIMAAAESLGWPVALKVVSPDISHKTEVAGVKLHLNSKEEIERAYNEIISSIDRHCPEAKISGFVVQPSVTSPDYELLLGSKQDNLFGPVVVFGMGGIFSELLRDRAIALPPLNSNLISQCVEQTRASKLLQGFRNLAPMDVEAFENMILGLSQLVTNCPEISELDINPIMVKNGKPFAVDARIILKESVVAAPLHLIISPYPEQYEFRVFAKNGRKLFIRPIKPEDASKFEELFATLSPSSVYYRFFFSRQQTVPEMLAILTQVDYDRHLALVAIDTEGESQRIMGVARIIADPEIERCEFSILVGDPWQGQGIGAQLLLCLLYAAKEQGVETIWGSVLRENRQMIELGKRCGFSVQLNPEEGTYDLEIDLKQVEL